MPLLPFIASYLPEAGAAAHRLLTDEVAAGVEVVARNGEKTDLAPRTLGELEELHVLRREAGDIRLATGVLLREDIERIVKAVQPMTGDLADAIKSAGSGLSEATPELRTFLGGVVGFGQGAGRAAAGEPWMNYSGRYPQTRVDFIEDCPAFADLGPDLLNRSVIRGERYTAVFIGPTGRAFKTFTYQIDADETSVNYRRGLNRYLADAYATLVTGEHENADLLASAEAANLYRDGGWRSAVVDNEVYARYEPAVRGIAEATFDWYDGHQQAFEELLSTTTSGHHGVRPETTMPLLRRLVRMMTASRLAEDGFITGDIAERGTLTVFYANDVPSLREALG